MKLLLLPIQLREPLPCQEEDLPFPVFFPHDIPVPLNPFALRFNKRKFCISVTHARFAGNIMILCIQIEYEFRFRRQILFDLFLIFFRDIYNIPNLRQYGIIELTQVISPDLK